MLNKSMKGARIALLIFWIAIIYNLVFPLPGLLYTILLYSLPILLLGHFAEWLMMKDKLRQAGHEGAGAFVNVIIYGFAWWLPILSNQQAGTTE